MSVPPRRNKPQRRPSNHDGDADGHADEYSPRTEPVSDDSLDDTVGEDFVESSGDDTLDSEDWEPVPTRHERMRSGEPDDQGDWKTKATEPPREQAAAPPVPTSQPSSSSSGGGTGMTSRRTSGRSSTSSPASTPYVPGADKVESRLPAGTMLGGRFEVIRQLGKGGMGEVFLVRDHQIEQREVALKLVRAKWSASAKFRELFFQEIRSAQKFVSPHVVQVRDCGQLPDGQLFLTMDYVAGESLSQLLRREKNLSIKHALEITRQLLMGLSSGHEHGFIHRDVKPGNLMLAARVLKTSDNPFGVKAGLLDFGLAALSAELEAERGPGTPHYMSPEQAMGQRLDARSDLFAVGIVLYEMLAGKRPFSGRTQKEVMTSVIETDPSPLIDNLEGVKKPIKKLLRKALQKEREKRYSSAADFLKAIDNVGPIQTDEGAPKAMTGIAVFTTIAAVAAGGLFFNERIGKKSADESFQRERNQFTEKSRQLTQTEAQLAAAERDVERLKAAAEGATQPLEETIAAKDREISQLNIELAAEKAELEKERIENARLSGELATDEVTEGLRKVDYNSLKIGAFKQIEDLLELIPRANDLEGTELATYGILFDRMTQQIINAPQGECNICSNELKSRRSDQLDVPGLGYLAQVEELSNEVGRLLGRAKDVSTDELESARSSLSSLSSPLQVSTFKDATTSLRGDTSDTGRWLGIKFLPQDELDKKFWSQIEAQVDEFVENEVLADATEEVQEEIRANIPDEDKRAKKFLGLMRENGGTGGLNKLLLEYHKDADLEAARLEALGTVFAKLGERLEEVQIAIDAGAAEIATAALEESNLQKKAQLIDSFATQASLNAPEIPGLLASCAKTCRSLVTSGGDLNMSALGSLPYTVGDLVDRLGEKGLDGDRNAAAAPLLELQWFVFAQRWYGSAVGTDLREGATPWMLRFAERLTSAPTDSLGAGSWKELLAFQVQLATECVGPPQADRATATFVVKYAGQREQWEQVQVTTNAGAKRLSTTEFKAGAAGKTLDPVPGPSEGASSFVWNDDTLVPFQRPLQNPEFVNWTPPGDPMWESMQQQQRGTTLANLSGRGRLPAVMRDAYREIPPEEVQYRCLRIVQADRTEYLVHPVLGVVRSTRKASTGDRITATRDLIHVQ